jgi:hypothetical protein
MTGRTSKFSTITVSIPPSIGAAMRCVTSDPVPLINMIGIKPAIVEMAVIATGHTRLDIMARGLCGVIAVDA